ncbi:MAG: molybdate ABC transporter permease subunit [Candidatus Magnetoovum sp. WYHC-5]|nr:molybdate ABC transporter permease subunit [Candidatus Magnetoovum sp. WYHC-5]
MAFSMLLSLKVSAVATIFVLIFGIPVAYVLAMKRFKARELIDVFLMLPLVLPPTVTGYYLVILLGRHGIIGRYIYEWTGFSIMFTWHAATVASFVVSVPLMIRTARAAIESVDKSLIMASYTLGYGEVMTALKVTIPLARRGIIAGAVLSFARAIGEFGATLMLAGNVPGKTDTMPLAIYSFAAAGQWSEANNMVIILTVMSLAIIYVANRLSRQ